MTAFRFSRRPWYKRLESFVLYQPIKQIEASADHLKLYMRGKWHATTWDRIKNPRILREKYRMHGPTYIKRTAEHLSFDIEDKTWRIDLSKRSAHFENNTELKRILLQHLQPTEADIGFGSKILHLLIIVMCIFAAAFGVIWFFAAW